MLRLRDSKIISAPPRGFILLAERFGGTISGPPRPLRRVLSLMRTNNYKCKTIICKSTSWTASNPCSGKECGKRIESCKDYISNLPLYDIRFIAKHCHKLCFFRSRFKNKKDIGTQSNKDLLGFCIVQIDEYECKLKGETVRNDCAYLTEVVLPSPFNDNWYSFCRHKVEIEIEGVPFEVEGSYFAQQNGITNSCSHAALKMATRKCYFSDHEITCEEINRAIGLDHKKDGGNALDGSQLRKAVEKLLNKTTLPINASSFEPEWFLQTLYCALESRLPVVLLFTLPQRASDQEIKEYEDKLLNGKKFEQLSKEEQEQIKKKINFFRYPGHAVALTGHTLSEHSWIGYASKEYFKDRNFESRYLPSYLWFDSFIIQDDVIGPHYTLPKTFLRDLMVLKKLIDVKEEFVTSTPLFTSSGYQWLTDETKCMNALVICPKEYNFILYTSDAERCAFDVLCRCVQSFEPKKLRYLQMSILFEKYFYDSYCRNDLILRTFIISKREYLYSVCKQKYMPKTAMKYLEADLPSLFWITEISIPELFWINKGKIGELITDPLLYSN